MLYNREKSVFSENNSIIWINSYYGYDIEYYLKNSDTQDKDFIFIDMSDSFYTFEHFFQFTVVKVFRKFIRTKFRINTIGQLYNFLVKLDFDRNLIELIKDIQEDKISRFEKFDKAWEILFRLGSKVGIRKFIIGDSDYFFEDRRNFSSNIRKSVHNILRLAEKSDFSTIFEFKNIGYFRDYIRKNHSFHKFSFDDISSEKDEIYELYYGELDLFLERSSYEQNKDKIDSRLSFYISKCRGENQVRYILLLLSLSGKNGLTVTELSDLMKISPGASGSVLNRIMQYGLIRKNGKRYIVKNDAYRKYILENEV